MLFSTKRTLLLAVSAALLLAGIPTTSPAASPLAVLEDPNHGLVQLSARDANHLRPVVYRQAGTAKTEAARLPKTPAQRPSSKGFDTVEFPITEDTKPVTGLVLASGANAYLMAAEWEFAVNDHDIVATLVPEHASPFVNISVDDSAADSFAPAVAYAADLDFYLIVWEDFEGTDSNIYGAVVDGTGQTRSESFPIADAIDEEFSPAVAYADQGDFVVFFGAAEDYSLQTGYIQLYAQRVNLDAAGTPALGDAILVAEDAAFPDATRVDDDTVLVVYQSLYASGSGPVNDWDWDIHGRLVLWSGESAGGAQVFGHTSAAEIRPSVALNATTNTALVAWDQAQSPTNRNIMAAAAAVNPSGIIGAPSVYQAVNSDRMDVAPAVAWDALSGTFLLAWQRDFSATDGDIHLVEVTPNGLDPGAPQSVSQTPDDQMAPAVACLNGWFLIGWQDNRSGAYNLFGRFYEHAAVEEPAPQLQVSPNPSGAYDFGSVYLDESAQAAFTVRNIGGGQLSGSASVSGTRFQIIGDNSYTLAPNATRAIQVRFIPDHIGDHTGSITFTGNSGSLTIQLHGTGAQLPPIGCFVGASNISVTPWGNAAVIGLVFVLLMRRRGTRHALQHSAWKVTQQA